MFGKLSKLLGIGEGRRGVGEPGVGPNDRLMRAIVTLFVKAAHLDGAFTDVERTHLIEVLKTRFKTNELEAARLIAEAFKAIEHGAEFYPITKVLRDEMEHEDRVELIEMLWEIVYADGELHDFEASLMRRVTGLVYVSDKESGDARRRAMEKLGLAD